jgi:hypothetical protein
MKTTKNTSIRIISIIGTEYLIGADLSAAEIMLLLKVGGSLKPIENGYIHSATDRYAARVAYLGDKQADFSISIKSVELLSQEEFRARSEAGRAAYDAANLRTTEGAK